MNFESLVGRINQVQDMLQAQTAHAINLAVTARNWLVGFYIVEFEQHGEDRAKYGENLLKNLAKRLNRRGLGERRLYEFHNRQDILRLPTAKLQIVENLEDGNLRLLTAKSHGEYVGRRDAAVSSGKRHRGRLGGIPERERQ